MSAAPQLSLCERLSFDKLFRISEPKRVYRSFTVKGPPLEIDSYQDVVYYIFNFKANPSTTGLRHKGYIKFFKPKNKNPKNVPLQHLDCLVDCECPDFRYRWAWANKQRQSSVVGPQSLNQAWNKAPRKTNPTSRPGLCKHILAARRFIYGLLSSFPGDEPDSAYKLDALTKHATKRWSDYEGMSRAAKAKEAEMKRRMAMRNIGQNPNMPIAVSTPVADKEPRGDAPARMPSELKPKETSDFKKVRPEPLPGGLAKAKPGGETPEKGEGAPEVPLPPGMSPEANPAKPVKKPAPKAKTPPVSTPAKRVLGNRAVRPPKPSDNGWNRSEEARIDAADKNLILERVVKTNGELMSAKLINEALKLVEEIETDELAAAAAGAPDTSADMGLGGDVGGETLEPSEPPVSDSAIGADTEGESALSLLRSMKDSLQQIAAAVAPVEELPPGEGDAAGGIGGGAIGGDLGGEPEGALGGEPDGDELPDMPDEPPTDKGPDAEEPAEGEGDEDEAEPKGEDKKSKGKKPELD